MAIRSLGSRIPFAALVVVAVVALAGSREGIDPKPTVVVHPEAIHSLDRPA
jgi:hypothetical protein